MSSSEVVAVVLAAGAGSRFDDIGHKLLARIPATADRPAETVSARAIGAAVESGIGQVVVVTGRLGADELGSTLDATLDTTLDAAAGASGDPSGEGRARVRWVHNPDWSSGQMTSVLAGLDAADDAGATVAVIGLADQPGVAASAWRSVADSSVTGSAIAVATYDGRRGNPVALRREVWGLLGTTGDHGARALMQVRPDLVVEVPCSGSPTDIDTAEDLRRWQSSSSTNSP
ncbi:nucleotidyltransferase family protein [Ilumatobacter sp.]|uniref:nucleotidyltransferase family protein n=1 Tax=Ilumatobacter sp. TaxID=1967498 RepID=UPI003B5265AE